MINLDASSFVALLLNFVYRGTNTPAVMDGLPFSVFDLDNGNDYAPGGQGIETL
jgi:hypothetical protein